MIQEYKLNAAGKDWNVEVIPQTETALRFEFYGCELHILPLMLGAVSEEYGIPRKLRHHETVDGLVQSIDFETVIPFGSEPVVRRNVEFAANHATVVSYFELKSNVRLDGINVDPLLLPGDWARVGIIPMPESGSAVTEPEWHDVKSDDQVFYDSEKPFLICLLEDGYGNLFEIGIGDDLWRWESAGEMEGASAAFTVKNTIDGVRIDRMVFKFPEEIEMPPRPWRFKWYFSWCDRNCRLMDVQPEKTYEIPEDGRFRRPKVDNEAFSVMGGSWPELSAVFDAAGNSTKSICFESAPVFKRLKKWIRSAASKEHELNIILTDVEPHICSSATHLERGKKQYLTHWDIMNLMDFYIWSLRKLDASGSTLHIIPPQSSAARVLPSIKGMGRAPEK